MSMTCMKWIKVILADSKTELALVNEDAFIGRIIFIIILGILECKRKVKRRSCEIGDS